ncbi:MAG: hypothetical protein ACLU38_12205 [Dysosmobacter sp.]
MPPAGEKSDTGGHGGRATPQEEVRRATTAEERTAHTLRAAGKNAEPAPAAQTDGVFRYLQHRQPATSWRPWWSISGAKPLKSAYRRFQIKELLVAIPDDYASMREVLRRRLQRAADGDEKFLPLPDVFLIDGGVTHADAVQEVAEALRRARCPSSAW